MGLLDRFFKKNTQDKEQTIQLPQDWDFYLCDIDGKVGSYFLNLALINIIPIVEKSALLWVELTMNQPTEDGMSSQQEFDTLIALEGQLTPQIKEAFDAVYISRLTHNGTRDFYFYLNENIYKEESIEKIIHGFPDYQFNFGLKNDPNWDIYSESIYPNIYAMQSIQNNRVIMNLEKHGDVLTVKRPVEHWCYFQTNEGKDLFLTAIQKRGYEIIDQSLNEESINPYCVQLVRIDSVELNSINEVTWELVELCTENGGEYDGWETPIIRN